MDAMLGALSQLRSVHRALPPDLLAELDAAIAACRPAEEIEARAAPELPPLQRYVLHLLHEQLTAGTVRLAEMNAEMSEMFGEPIGGAMPSASSLPPTMAPMTGPSSMDRPLRDTVPGMHPMDAAGRHDVAPQPEATAAAAALTSHIAACAAELTQVGVADLDRSLLLAKNVEHAAHAIAALRVVGAQ